MNVWSVIPRNHNNHIAYVVIVPLQSKRTAEFGPDLHPGNVSDTPFTFPLVPGTREFEKEE